MNMRFLKKVKKMPIKNWPHIHTRAFTLIELLVSLAIFAFMTAFLLAKYGTFNQNTLLTNVAYDTALTIRTAQNYGLNVQNATTDETVGCGTGAQYSSGGSCFYYAYGVHFDGTGDHNAFTLFLDLNTGQIGAGVYVLPLPGNTPSEVINTYKMNTGYSIQSLCVGSDANHCTNVNSLDITFRRPIPDAVINGEDAVGGTPSTSQSNQAYAKITLTANGSTKSVVVQSTGQISITN